MNKKLNRREFLRLGRNAALSLAGLSVLPRSVFSSTSPSFTDYKALVCISLNGGNDSVNMILPTVSSGESGYDIYAAIRGLDNEEISLAVNNVDLSSGLNSTGNLLSAGWSNPYYQNASRTEAYLKGMYHISGTKPFGIHGMMPELAQLVNSNTAGIIANAGTLIRPVTRSEIQAGTADLPSFLFSHNSQRTLTQTGEADNPYGAGWAGRLFDNWQQVNNDHLLGMNIAYGRGRLPVGRETTPLRLNPGSPPTYKNLTGEGVPTQARRQLYLDLHGLSMESRFKNLYNRMLLRSFELTDVLAEAWESTDSTFDGLTSSYGHPLFSVPEKNVLGIDDDINGHLIRQLEAVARMIAYSKEQTDIKRQIFFVQQGGYDTHGSQKANHPLLLREFSLALWDFQQAMNHLSLTDQVTSYNLSDFGRTVTNNSDGTGHAWGGHYLVMGGSINGGQLYGDLPDLTLGGIHDHGSKGRLIPQIATDQIQASLARWFGVDDTLMPTIFPNIDNFSTRYLNFI